MVAGQKDFVLIPPTELPWLDQREYDSISAQTELAMPQIRIPPSYQVLIPPLIKCCSTNSQLVFRRYPKAHWVQDEHDEFHLVEEPDHEKVQIMPTLFYGLASQD